MPDGIRGEDSTSLLPIRQPVSLRDDRRPRIVEISADGATEVFDALSSETARALLSAVHESPRTASNLAETVGTSVQNVQYHLRKFEEAELVEVVDTWYSTRGVEMNVYGPADRSLVLYTGTGLASPPLGEALSRLVGGVGILGIVSLLVDRLVRILVPPPPATADGPGGTPPNQVDPVLFEFAGVTFSPGLVFFTGGLFVLLAATVWWYERPRFRILSLLG